MGTNRDDDSVIDDDFDWIEPQDQPQQQTELDEVLCIAEAKRLELIDTFEDMGFQEGNIASGAINHKAYWSWSFLLKSDGHDILTSVIINLDEEGRCTYEVETIFNYTRAYSTAGIAESMEEAPALAFHDLYKLYATMAEEHF